MEKTDSEGPYLQSIYTVLSGFAFSNKYHLMSVDEGFLREENTQSTGPLFVTLKP